MLKALIEGQEDAAVLADLAQRRMRAKIPELTDASGDTSKATLVKPVHSPAAMPTTRKANASKGTTVPPAAKADCPNPWATRPGNPDAMSRPTTAKPDRHRAAPLNPKSAAIQKVTTERTALWIPCANPVAIRGRAPRNRTVAARCRVATPPTQRQQEALLQLCRTLGRDGYRTTRITTDKSTHCAARASLRAHRSDLATQGNKCDLRHNVLRPESQPIPLLTLHTQV